MLRLDETALQGVRLAALLVRVECLYGRHERQSKSGPAGTIRGVLLAWKGKPSYNGYCILRIGFVVRLKIRVFDGGFSGLCNIDAAIKIRVGGRCGCRDYESLDVNVQ